MTSLHFLFAGAVRSLDTMSVRAAARMLGVVVLFCVWLGAARGADSAVPSASLSETPPAVTPPSEDTAAVPVARELSSPAGQEAIAPVAPESVGKVETPPAEKKDVPEHGRVAAPAASETEAPTPPDARIAALADVGTEFWLRGERETAERTFADALSLDVPAEAKRELLMRMVQLYENGDDMVRAIAVLEKVLDTFPDDREHSQLMMRLGLMYREIGAYSAATARFYQVLNSTMRYSLQDLDERRRLATKARLEIADTFLAQGNIEEARKYYSLLQLLDLEPTDRERVQFREAQLQHELHLWEPAERGLGAFLKDYPHSSFTAEARYLRAKALKELGRKDEAVQEVVALLRSQDDATDPALAKSVAYWKRRTGNELANTFYEQGDFLGALAIYQALARAGAEPAWRWPAVYQVGLCFERLNLPQRAQEAYKIIVSPDPAPPSDRPLSDTLVALQGMAKWRLDHLDWMDQFEIKLKELTAGKPAGA